MRIGRFVGRPAAAALVLASAIALASVDISRQPSTFNAAQDGKPLACGAIGLSCNGAGWLAQRWRTTNETLKFLDSAFDVPTLTCNGNRTYGGLDLGGSWGRRSPIDSE